MYGNQTDQNKYNFTNKTNKHFPYIVCHQNSFISQMYLSLLHSLLSIPSTYAKTACLVML